MPDGQLPTQENDGDITYFAQSDYRNKNTMFGIRRADRSRHTYVIGKTGMGKSTMLSNMAIQDIENGNGLCVIDPHGELADSLLDYVPEERIEDVMYFAPFDLEHPISFNVLEDVGADKRHLVADGLLSAFKKIWVDAWSGRMEYLLNNALLALMEYPDATLLGVNRMFADKRYRVRVVQNVTDASVKAFWEDEYANYDERFARQAAAAIQNKVGQFVSNPLVRNVIGQQESSFDVRKLMDNKKIMLVNLSKGRVGEDSARLIGSMLITKMYLAAMGRADATRRDLSTMPQFYFYVDEFQSFANESFAGILSEARKYKLNLTIAHQYIEQMDEEVRNAVFGNVGTMVCFRVGAYDAEVLEKEFQPTFTQEDLVNLGFAQIYLKLMIGGVSSKPFSARTLPPIPEPDQSFKDDIIAHSRKTYGQKRETVEQNIEKWYDSTYGIIDDEEARAMAEKQRKEREQEQNNNGGGSSNNNQDDSSDEEHGEAVKVRLIGAAKKRESKSSDNKSKENKSTKHKGSNTKKQKKGNSKKEQTTKQEQSSASSQKTVTSDDGANKGSSSGNANKDKKKQNKHKKKSKNKSKKKKKASLKSLASSSKKESKKEPSEENKSALQSALKGILKDGGSNLEKDLSGDESNKSKKEQSTKRDDRGVRADESATEESESNKDSDSSNTNKGSGDANDDFDRVANETPQEIPEDVLREMLEVDEEEVEGQNEKKQETS